MSPRERKTQALALTVYGLAGGGIGAVCGGSFALAVVLFGLAGALALVGVAIDTWSV